MFKIKINNECALKSTSSLPPPESCFLMPFCNHHYNFTTNRNVLLSRHWQTFSRKGQIVNILAFVGSLIPAATTQLCIIAWKQAQTTCEQWAWLCSCKTVFAKTGIGQNLTPETNAIHWKYNNLSLKLLTYLSASILVSLHWALWSFKSESWLCHPVA